MIEGNGGLDIKYCACAAREDHCSLKKFITEYVKTFFECSNFVAKKVAEYYLQKGEIIMELGFTVKELYEKCYIIRSYVQTLTVVLIEKR